MRALTEVVPQLSPMVSITGTGFTVPVKLASRAFATNEFHSVPVCLISTPLEGEEPVLGLVHGSVLTEGAGGMVVAAAAFAMHKNYLPVIPELRRFQPLCTSVRLSRQGQAGPSPTTMGVVVV